MYHDQKLNISHYLANIRIKTTLFMKNIYNEYWSPLCSAYHNVTIIIKNYIKVDIHETALFQEAFSGNFFSSKSRYPLNRCL